MARSILILTNRIPYPLHDGGALAMNAMIRGYEREGWSVHVLAMNTSRHRVTADILAGLYPGIAGFHSVEVDNTVSKWGILKNLLFSAEPEHVARFRNAAFAEKLRILLRQVQPDVVQLESPFLASYISIIRKESRARLVYRMHNVEAQIWSQFAEESAGIKRLYLRNLAKRMRHYERGLWQQVDLLLTITAKDADAVKTADVSAATLIAPYGITLPPLTPAARQKGNLKVYHIGAMDWLPNAEGVRWFLNEVWPLVQRLAPETEFHFAGRAMPDSFKTALLKGVYCAGEVGDVSAFVADKHLLIVPIRAGSGIRIKALEAMAAGKLVVSTEVGMQGIEAEPGLHYLQANDPQEFAQLIAWASTHADEVEAFTVAAQRLILEQYDSDLIMKRIIAGLEGILQ